MEEKKKEIISQALKTYMKYGIKSITMDEMARQLGVSKKTLYQYVKDKNDLVEQCLLFAHDMDCSRIEEIYHQGKDAVAEALDVNKYILEQLRSISPSVFFDLAKYHPSALKLMHNHKYDVVCGAVSDNLKRGIEQELYRENMNVEIISTMYMAFIDHVMAGDLFDQGDYPPDQVYSEFFRYHIRGIATAKGLERLKELIESDEYL